jgi:hypothetical protein
METKLVKLMTGLGYVLQDEGWTKSYGGGIVNIVVEFKDGTSSIKAFSKTKVLYIDDFTSQFLSSLSLVKEDMIVLKTKVSELRD